MLKSLFAVCLLAAAAAAESLPNPFRDIPPERNAWPVIGQALALQKRDNYPWPSYPDADEPTRPLVRAYLAANAPALAKLDEALARPDLAQTQAEVAARLDGSGFASTGAHRLGAIRDLDDLLTLADRLDAGPGTLIDWLVTRVEVAFAAAGAKLLLGPPPAKLDVSFCDPTMAWPIDDYPPAERQAWLALARHFEAEGPTLSSLRLAFGGELIYIRHQLDKPAVAAQLAVASPEVRARFLQRLEQHYLAVADAACLPAAQRDPKRLTTDAVDAKDSDEVKEALQSFESVPRHLDRDLTLRRLAATAIALRLYAADHHQLPADLAPLVADGLLPAVPVDAVDGKTLRYRPRQGLIYGLGFDGADHGGTPRDNLMPLLFVIGRKATPPVEWDTRRRWRPTRLPVTLK
jgi:hypothetical protein